MKKSKTVAKATLPPQSVAEAEIVLRKLEVKREELLASRAELEVAKKSAAYDSFTDSGGDHLASVVRSLRSADADIESLDLALAEARNRVMVAQAFERQAAAEANATKILELTRKLREAGQRMDDACKVIGQTGKELSGLLLELHGLGVRSPTMEQWLVHGGCALATAVAGTPWSRNYRSVPPLERKQFGSLVSSWATAIESRTRKPTAAEAA
jgi:hypothetical protein